MITLLSSYLGSYLGSFLAVGPDLPQGEEPYKHAQLPVQASTFAEGHDQLYVFVEWINYIFFFGIMGVLFYSVIKYRRKSEDQPPASTVTHHTAIEVTWTVVPLIVMMVIFALGWKGYSDMALATADSLQYEVQASRWMWEFRHPGQVDYSPTPKLYAPVNRPCQLTMHSTDVLHAFFVPAFRVKRDVLPGRFQTIWFEATKTGRFPIFCAEYCGTNHSLMLGEVIVVSEETWDAYMSGDEDKPWVPAYDPDDPVKSGEMVYNSRCKICHRRDDVKFTGPGFGGIWGKDEKLITGKTVKVDADYIQKSIRKPGADVVEGFADTMTLYSEKQVPDEHIVWLTEFIKSLGKKN